MSVSDWKVSIPEGVSGDVKIERFTVDKPDLHSTLRGRGITPGTYTALYRKNSLWMSDTPAEQRDHYEAVYQMRNRGGRVLIMGLGIGMVVQQALALPNVDHVDVIEMDPDVIKLVGPHYESERCTIHQGDAMEFKWPRGTRWTTIWHDIWRDMSESNLPQMEKLARSYGRRCDWQGFWGKEHILRERSRWAW